jgi:hypothetical protein
MDELRQEISQAHNSLWEKTCIISSLQHEVYQKSMYPYCNHEGIIAALQQELWQKSMYPVCNHEDILALLQQEQKVVQDHEATIASLQQKLSQTSVPPPVCSHEKVIASLQLDLYHAKTDLARRSEQRVPSEFDNRIESILLKRIDSTGIPDKTMLDTIRLDEPRLRRADLYKKLNELKKKGLIVERPDRVWAKSSRSQRT